jgi:quercetin dioxygenase-like cupin family protein
MPATSIVMTEQDYARPYAVLGMQVSVLASGEKTGSYEIVQLAGDHDSGLPAHHHPWAESFYILKGEVEFGLGEDITWGAPGTVIHIPAGVTHGFHFGQAGAVVLSVASRPGTARLYASLDRELSADQSDLSKLGAIGARYGFTVVSKNKHV